MKTRILNVLKLTLLLLIPTLSFAQAPPLGTSANFVMFTTIGAVGNTGISHLTGNVGTNNGGVTGFGNVNGVMTFTSDPKSAQCATDLLIAYNQLNSTVPTYFPAPLLGNGDTLIAGVYSVTGATTMNGTLYLNALGNSNAVFILQIQGPLSTAASSKVILLNGAKACNVFWKIEGLVSMAPSTSMKGTVIANNAAINMSSGCVLEGRVLSTNGAVNVSGVLAYTPVGCGSPSLTGPLAPNLVSAACYAIFSSNGPVTNVGITNITGDVGTNSGLTTGFNPLFVTGLIHPIPDGSTAAAAADLLNAYSYLNTLPYDIELLYPAQFGNQLVLTPHTYLMNGAVTFTDTLFLDAMNDANAVFVIKIYGAINTSTYSKVKMINGTQSKNVYWMISGAVTINDYSEFVGTIVCNNGAMNLNTGAKIDGRALTTTGALNTAAITAIMPPGCSATAGPLIITEPVNKTACSGDSVKYTVTASGSSLTYQWRKGNVDLINGGNISGATSDTLRIFPASLSDTSSNYNVIVSGLLLPNDTSVNVSLVVNTPPIITTEPSNQNACVGNAVKLFIIASGSNLTYQWRKGTLNLINGVNISGATSDTLKFNSISISDTSTQYNVIVYGSCLPNDTSINASIIVNIPILITTQPVTKTACLGSAVYFSVVATGSNLTYQWRKGTVNLINGANISGAISDTVRINAMLISDTASNYNVIISGACLPKDTSINVSLLRASPPIITTEPVNKSVCSGNSAYLTVSATGTNLTYQWRKGNVNLITSANISGVNSNTLTFNPAYLANAAVNYNVIVSGGCLPNDTSLNASLLVDTVVTIITQPVNKTVCVGNSVYFLVVASGSGNTYQWRKGSVNLINGGNISGATSDTLRINPATLADTAYNYNVVVTGLCSSVNSNVTNLNTAGEFGILAGVGISSTGFSVISNMNVGISPGVRSSITGFPPASIVNGAIYASDDVAPPGVAAMLIQAKQDLTNAYLFAEGATAPAPVTVAGDQGGITLAPGIYKSTSTLLIQSGNLTLDGQGNANAVWIFQVASDFTTVGGAGGSVILTGGAQAKNVTWQIGSSATIGNGTSFKGNILALTSITMNTGSSIDGRLLARNGAVVLSGTNIINNPSAASANGTTLTSTIVSLVVTPLPVTSVISGNATPNCNAIAQIYSVTNTPGSTYAWTVPAGAIITAGGGTNSITVTFGTTNGNISVIETTSNACVGSQVSKTITLLGCGLIANFTANITSVCSGSSVVFTNTSTGTTPTTTYSWNFGTGATPATITGIGPHTVIYSGSGSSTVSLTITDGASNTKTVLNYITVIPNNTIILTSAIGTNNQTVCVNSPIVNISYTTTGATGANFSLLPAGITASWLANVITISGTPTATGVFNYTVNLTGGCGTISTTGSITVIPINSIVLTSAIGTDNQTHCINTAITNIIYATTGATGATFSGLPAGVTANWLANVVTISGTPTAAGIFNYTVNLTGGCGTISTTGSITVTPNNTIVLTSGFGSNNQNLCINTAFANINYTTTGATGATFSGLPAGITAIWLANVVTISGTPTASGIFNYIVNLTGGCGTISATGTITVNPNNTIVLTSVAGTDNQFPCVNTAITNITYATTGATGATFSGLPAGITATWLANLITISGTPTATGIFNYTINLTGGCGIISINGTITVNSTIGATIFIFGATYICQNSPDETYIASATSSTSIVYSVLPATAGVINSSTGVMNWDVNFSGTATITATSTGLCGTTTANRVVTVIPLPIAVAGSNSPVCVNSPLNLTAQTVTGGTYSWTGPNSYSTIVQNPVIISAILANAGNYILTVTANGCISLPATVAVVVNICPSDLSVVKTVNISNPLKGTTVVFTIVATNNGPYTATGVIVTDYLQSGYTFVSYTSSPSGVYNPVTGIWTIGNLSVGASSTLYITAIVNSTGSYVNTATITGNEIDVILTNNTSTIETIPTDFFIPQGFSPNGDGINDLFVIRGIELYPANSIVIFNRWGNKVFEASPYQNTWDGKAKMGLIIGDGDRLPIGTYFYILNLGNNSDVIKGTIYLNK